MRKKILFILILVLVYGCSSSSDTGSIVIDETSNEKSFLVGINVVGNFFDDNTEGMIYASDENGQIMAQGILENNSTTNLEAEFDFENSYDLTILLRNKGSIGLIDLKTFKDVSPETYTLTEKPLLNPDNETVNISLFNTGTTSLSVLAPNSFSAVGADGTFELNAILESSPGDFYAAFLNPNEFNPRYLFIQNVAITDIPSFDYAGLPTMENVYTFNYQFDGALRLKVTGLRDFEGMMVGHDFFSESYESLEFPIPLFSPDGIFESFRVSSEIVNGEVVYNFTSFESLGNGSSSIEAPDFDFDISSDTMSNFRMTTVGNYDYYEIEFFDFVQTTSTSIIYRIYGSSSPEVSIESVALFDSIFAGESEIEAKNMTNRLSSILQNSSEITFNETIKNIIEDVYIYPNGTLISSISK